MNYSVEQIIALAPDAASAKADRSLATASKWQNVGRDERAVWGRVSRQRRATKNIRDLSLVAIATLFFGVASLLFEGFQILYAKKFLLNVKKATCRHPAIGV
jgi:hypothetical protein